MTKMLKCAMALAGLAALAACASSPPEIGGAPDLEVLSLADLPPPQSSDYTLNTLPSYLGPADLVEVTVAGVEWLTAKEVRIDASGEMSFPLAGPVTAAGLTPRELESVLTTRLVSNGQMVDPQVSVNVMETQSRVVTIEGEVDRPGVYPVNGRITLMQAVALGWGTNEFSALDEVVVFRTVAGQRYAALYDLEAIRIGAYPDPAIYPNDIVMVGEESSRRLFKDIISVIPLFTSPLVIAIDRFAN